MSRGHKGWFPTERNRELVERLLAEPDLSAMAIAKEYKISRQRVGQILKQAGIKRPQVYHLKPQLRCKNRLCRRLYPRDEWDAHRAQFHTGKGEIFKARNDRIAELYLEGKLTANR